MQVGPWWWQLLLVMVGGALCASGRFCLGGLLLRQLGHGFPWGTFAVNMIGAFAAGYLVVWLETRGSSAIYWRAFLVVGVLGALTTFSALMVECLLFARSDRTGMLLAYVLASLMMGMLLVWAGARMASSASSHLAG